jgi:acyl-coenzyme A synthetase/AMP-(fatty) acid ligase
MPLNAGLTLDRLRDFSRRAPEQIVFVEDGHPITVSSLQSASNHLASRMKEAGAGRVAVFSNRPSVLATSLLASFEAGCELMILRSTYAADDPLWSVASVDAIVEQDLEIRRISVSGEKVSGDPAVLISTSGTSGTPKIARHSLATLMGRVRPAYSARGQVRWLLTYQPYGFAGLQVLLTSLATDSTIVCLSEINVPQLARAAVEHRVTHISGTPTFWRSFLLCLRSTALPELDQITLGGEVVDQSTLDRLRAVFPNARCSHIYASTEAGALFSVRDGQAGFPSRWLQESVDEVSLRIRDGVLEVHSPRQMLGYVNSQDLMCSPDGWLITGDRVEQRGERVYFLGREDSLINVGGAKVTPEEVESELLDVRHILDLRAFAIANPITGFVVGLEVVAEPESDIEKLRQEILRTARQKLLPYKLPRLIRFVDAVRCDASGKKSRHTE